MTDYSYAIRLKNYMVKEGLNQVMMAERLGVPTSSLCNWLKGNRLPSAEYKKKIDAFLEEKQEEASIAKNGSGYYDPTMHKALKNIVSESKPACLRGDIYIVEMKNTSEKKMLVVGADDRKTDRWISVVLLNDESRGRNSVPIIAGAMMYADCDRVTYIDRNNVLNFIRTATEEEMNQIDKAICEGLGINTSDVELYNNYEEAVAKVDALEKERYELDECRLVLLSERDRLQLDCEYLIREVEELKNNPAVDSDEVIRLKAMVDIYKEQNQMLLEKLIG